MSYSHTNTSSIVTYQVTGFNVTDQWHHFSRNMTEDLSIFTTSEDWRLLSISVIVECGSDERVSLLVDDIHFMDANPPIIHEVDWPGGSVQPNEAVNVEINTTDASPGIGIVNLYYSTGEEWTRLETTSQSDVYSATIPGLSHGSEVQFYVNATDLCGKSAIDDNSGLNYSYSVIDTIDPTLSFTSPSNNSEVPHDIWIEIDVNDNDGVRCVEWYQNGSRIANFIFGPYDNYWYANQLELGTYKISVIVRDFADNSVEKCLILTVIDNHPPNINHPDDVTFTVGTTGHSIVWEPWDARPESYVIYRNGTEIASGNWNSTIESSVIVCDHMTVNLDALDVGVYNYTISVQDTVGHVSVDTVIVTVEDDSTSTSTTTTTTTTDTTTDSETDTSTTPTTTESEDDDTLLILIIAGVGAIVIVLVVVIALRKRKK